MSLTIDRVVDAHVHLWDPARADWYPFLSVERPPGTRDGAGMYRRFDYADYVGESIQWNVGKFVHVAAARPPFAVQETAELQELAQRTGNPAAIIGSINAQDPTSETEQRLDSMMLSPHFRGVRSVGSETGTPPAAVLEALVERDLVFDLMVKSDQLDAARAVLMKHAELTVVLEHAGWPRDGSALEFQQWARKMAALASGSDKIHCKISGLSMALHSMELSVMRPWIEHCIDVFGPDRCFFASNFPVDSAYGTFDELYSIYARACSGINQDELESVFASNAERVYRC